MGVIIKPADDRNGLIMSIMKGIDRRYLLTPSMSSRVNATTQLSYKIDVTI